MMFDSAELQLQKKCSKYRVRHYVNLDKNESERSERHQELGKYRASQLVCQLHYDSLVDGSLFNDNDTLSGYFGLDIPINTVKGLLRQEFKDEYGEEVGPGGDSA